MSATHPSFHAHDWEERRHWQDPEAILRDIGLKPGDVFVDVGCGDGFFAIPAARMVGESGRVLALDISLEPVKMLRERAEREGLSNIETTVGPAEKTVLCGSCADFVFFGIDLHDFAYPNLVLKNARVMLKPGGLLVDVDWKKIETPFGPPLAIRFDEEKAAGLITDAGFTVIDTRQLPPWHYMIVARIA